jgi:hypothetical protein
MGAADAWRARIYQDQIRNVDALIVCSLNRHSCELTGIANHKRVAITCPATTTECVALNSPTEMPMHLSLSS